MKIPQTLDISNVAHHVKRKLKGDRLTEFKSNRLAVFHIDTLVLTVCKSVTLTEFDIDRVRELLSSITLF